MLQVFDIRADLSAVVGILNHHTVMLGFHDLGFGHDVVILSERFFHAAFSAAVAFNCILRRPAASDAELNGRDAVCQRPAGLRY